MADPVSWDLLDEDCSDISDWIDEDNINGVSEVSPAGQFRFDSNTTAASNYARRSRDIGSLPNVFTAEVKLYHDSVGIKADNDQLRIAFFQSDEYAAFAFASDGLWVVDSDNPGWAEVGVNLVKQGGSAEWQIWRFIVTFTEVTGNGTCDVYLNDSTHNWEKVGTGIACSQETPGTDGEVEIAQFGYTTDNMLTHIDYIKIATGLYAPVVSYFSGYVFEQNNPVSRKLYLHNRSTGDLVTTTTSSGNGYYYLETASSGSHYIVCLDDVAGEEYNDLIIGSAVPTEIV